MADIPLNQADIINKVYDREKNVLKTSANVAFDATKINIGDVGLVDKDENPYEVQNPLPTNGDSIYGKDVIESESTIGTFSGKTITELFSDYHTDLIDNSTTNPKTFTIHLERPVKTALIAFGSNTGNFSNVKIFLRNEQGENIYTVDDSLNDTKYTSNAYPLQSPVVFVDMCFEFHTPDPVTVSGIFVTKYRDVIAVIQGLDDSTGQLTTAKFDNGEFIVGGKVGLKNTSQTNIDPATEQKQDAIIAALGGTIDTLTSRYHADSVDSNIAYSGFAVVASLDSAAVWQIQKLDFTNGNVVVKFADGNDSFDNIYDDRESLSYS